MATTITVWSKEEIRGVIRFLWAKGCNPTDIHKELTTVYSGDILSVQHGGIVSLRVVEQQLKMNKEVGDLLYLWT